MMSDLNELRQHLRFACECLWTRRTPEALTHLKAVQAHVTCPEITVIEAEYAVLYACALSELGEDGADGAFEEALRLTVHLVDDQELQMLAHALYGRFLAKRKAFTKARTQFVTAERIAQCLGRGEIAAELQLETLKLNLQRRKDPLLKAFRNLEQAAINRDSAVNQRNVWCSYIDDRNRLSKHRVAARKGEEASIASFRKRLDQAKRSNVDVHGQNGV